MGYADWTSAFQNMRLQYMNSSAIALIVDTQYLYDGFKSCAIKIGISQEARPKQPAGERANLSTTSELLTGRLLVLTFNGILIHLWVNEFEILSRNKNVAFKPRNKG